MAAVGDETDVDVKHVKNDEKQSTSSWSGRLEIAVGRACGAQQTTTSDCPRMLDGMWT